MEKAGRAVATWDDLVLPDSQHQTLHDIAAQSSRGLGVSALFTGASGTGKTLAAEVLARDLRLDLHRVHLPSVVSEYIGETEKNLRRVFDAAENGVTILLFDEGDALFRRRSEGKDSHDRYANVEVSYLLQRIETYEGLSILTTNLMDAIDPAFVRRFRFIVHFSFPDAEHRLAIWRRIFPPETPVQRLDFGKLSQLNVTGGDIRNIALNAAFLAVEDDMPVSMKHLLQATQSESIKLERPLADAEVEGWIE